MKFFVPSATSDKLAEEVIELIAKFLQRPVPPVMERLRRLKYEHNGQVLEVEVGKTLPDHYQEAVLSQFLGAPRCSSAQGTAALPAAARVYVGVQSVIEAEYFDADEC